MDISRILQIIQSENDNNSRARYFPKRDLMVSIPQKGHTGYGKTSCYIWETSKGNGQFWERSLIPDWLDPEALEDKEDHPASSTEFSERDIALAEEIINGDH